MCENITCFFSFPFMTRNVQTGRSERDSEMAGVTVQFFCETSLPYCFVRPKSKSSLVYIIFQTSMQILMITHLTYSLHMDMPPSSMSPMQFLLHFRQCPLFPLMYLCPLYFRKGNRCTSCCFSASSVRSF